MGLIAADGTSRRAKGSVIMEYAYLHNPSCVMFPHELAAYRLSEEQYAPGVTVRMNPRTYKVEYVRPDGSIVQDYQYFLKLIQEEIREGRK